jgi:hypothetical protein
MLNLKGSEPQQAISRQHARTTTGSGRSYCESIKPYVSSGKLRVHLEHVQNGSYARTKRLRCVTSTLDSSEFDVVPESDPNSDPNEFEAQITHTSEHQDPFSLH